jgi:hypothetical protein
MSRKLSGVLIQHKTGTASQWTSVNPTLAKGEIGFETDTAKVKIGDGVASWENLAYIASGRAIINFHSFNQFIMDASAGNKTASITALNNPFTGSGSIAVTLDISTSGVNGLDTGSVTSGWYYVFLCYGTSGLCCLASASSTMPTLPSGYAQFVRVGALRYGSSNAFQASIQHGTYSKYIGNMYQFASGSTGGESTFVGYDISTYIPETSYIVECILYNSSNSGGHSCKLASEASVFTAELQAFQYNRLHAFIHLNSHSIYYASNDGGSWASCDGWIDNL